MSLLEVSGLHSYYGDSHILFDVSLRVERNEVVALLGRNGAGKSTMVKSLMGVVRPRAGSVRLDGLEIAGMKSHAIARAGVQLVHEERRIFGSLTVEENLVLAGLTRRSAGRWHASTTSSRAYTSAARAAAPISRAGNSRCSRLGAR
jgi:branched-chain amino acid transport system ATP-binding protein